MKLGKSLLLGSAAAFVATAGAQAADLPMRKAAPVEYVKVCDAYGAGFFYIPGTDTCIKIGGRVRADYSMSGTQTIYASNVMALNVAGVPVNRVGLPAGTLALPVANSVQGWNGAAVVADPSGANLRFIPNGSSNHAQNAYGWEARGRVDLDARTQSAWGTVQTVVSVRLARTTGVLNLSGPGLSAASASPTLEAAYIRFAGFTFGAAKDNFSFMPSTFYGAGHWSSFANGAKQLAYTAVFGGGFSATIAVQDATDTTAGGAVAANSVLLGLPVFNATAAGYVTAQSGPGISYAYNNLPQLNGTLALDQGWGTAQVMGAVGKAVGVNAAGTFDQDKTVWAIGAGLKLNLPTIAAGDVLYLNAAYANGMTEYTTNWTSFKSSDTNRNVGGYVNNHPSWISANVNGVDTIQTLKSWDIAALYTHYWTPSIRHSFLASYGQIDGTAASKAQVYGSSGAYGDAKVWNIGTQLAWLPVRNFEIGMEVLYARVEQDIRRLDYAVTPVLGTVPGATVVTREKAGNWTGRMRVERTF
ncbi:MAG: hypothetical protein JWM36_2862 [Hyphomicrobiales bacterium]|nr:hypothetical protein [Hyphomicrobiales bacterium]